MAELNTRPSPRLARGLLRLLAGRQERAYLIGDLEEEYRRRASAGAGAARAWYWREAARSAPHLVALRLARGDAASLLAATVLGYLATFAWDWSVARTAARWFTRLMHAGPPFTVPRTVYVMAQLFGCILVGLAFALTAFQSRKTYWCNVITRLAPLILLLIVPMGFILARGVDHYSPAVRATWLICVAPSLLFGAWLGRRMRKEPK